MDVLVLEPLISCYEKLSVVFLLMLKISARMLYFSTTITSALFSGFRHMSNC
jgi:hypothetical protein